MLMYQPGKVKFLVTRTVWRAAATGAAPEGAGISPAPPLILLIAQCVREADPTCNSNFEKDSNEEAPEQTGSFRFFVNIEGD